MAELRTKVGGNGVAVFHKIFLLRRILFIPKFSGDLFLGKSRSILAIHFFLKSPITPSTLKSQMVGPLRGFLPYVGEDCVTSPKNVCVGGWI